MLKFDQPTPITNPIFEHNVYYSITSSGIINSQNAHWATDDNTFTGRKAVLYSYQVMGLVSDKLTIVFL